jgi:DNA-binding protein HU-beta
MQSHVTIRGGTESNQAKIHPKKESEGDVNKPKLTEKASSSKGEARRCLEALMETIREALEGGDGIHIAGFGKFYVQERKAREGVNPQTRDNMRIPASQVPAFSAGNALKKAV